MPNGSILSGLKSKLPNTYKSTPEDLSNKYLKDFKIDIEPYINRTSKVSNSKIQFGSSKSNSKVPYGEIDQALQGINKSLVDSEKTGKVSQIAGGFSDAGHQVLSQVNPLGGMVTSAAKLTGNLIGGTKDRVEGSGSAIANSAADALATFGGPWGMVAGAAINIINGIGIQGRARGLADETSSFKSGYSGSASDIHSTINQYAHKKAGTFDFGFKSKANKRLNSAETMQNKVLYNQDIANKALNNIYGDLVTQQNVNLYSGYTPRLFIKKGMKFPELEDARKLISSWSIKSPENQSLQKFQLGGKLNLIPEGALHARKHNLEEANPELEGQITRKGIPVVSQSENGIVQHAEIEKEEVVFRKEFTDELEKLYKLYQEKQSDEIAIKAGKLICYELLKNTDDRSGLIKSIK